MAASRYNILDEIAGMNEILDDSLLLQDSQLQEESEYEIENVKIELPDLEETQIVDELPDQVST